MIVGRKYTIPGEQKIPDYHNNQPYGNMIVECYEDHGNDFFTVILISKAGNKLDKRVGGWLLNTKTTYYELV